MIWSRKRGHRRREIHRNRLDASRTSRAEIPIGGKSQDQGVPLSLWVAVGFCIVTILVLTMREDVVPYRPGQYTASDIVSRVTFSYNDKDQLLTKQRVAREMEPHVFTPTATAGEPWQKLQEQLLKLPQQVAKVMDDELPPTLKGVLDSASLNKLQEYASSPERYKSYVASVTAYVEDIRKRDPVILSEDQRRSEAGLNRVIAVAERGRVDADSTYALSQNGELVQWLSTLAQKSFVPTLAPAVAQYTVRVIQPTHQYNAQATTAAQNAAADRMPVSEGDIVFNPKDTIVPAGEITPRHWQLLRAENAEYRRSHDNGAWRTRAGLMASVVLMTIILSAYIAKYAPRIVRNHARATAIAGLMISMLLLVQLAGLGSSPTYVFGIAPTIIVAMILAIAYEQRLARGIATAHAILATMALNEGLAFFLVLWSGVITCCFLLGDIRTRSRLIEVGGLVAVAMMLASCAAGLIRLDPMPYIARNCLYAGAAGLGCGFIVLGILPFIEKAFRITTSMTLLELADASQPLLRRLALEAPGTYNHSLQVATLSEEAAEAIGANSLLCRVGSYYHDIGKINKADYFIENQVEGQNRHINLSPSVSLLIITGHVKDGIELAREYNLPTNLFPFIQQHHGTTLVEFFYHRACDTCTPDQPDVSETQYRYPGPKPRSKEVAIVMLCDCVESAARAMAEPTSSRIEALVHDLAMKRLMDQQFDECDMTMKDLAAIEKSLVKTLQGIYHGRIAYPSTASIVAPATFTAPTPAVRSA
jgi:putative nucleotidyltransferase with HDIG domain